MDEDAPSFLALGPLEVRVAGRVVDLGSHKQRAVLAVLLTLAPHPVPVSRLVDEIWPDGGPSDPLRSLQVYVSALRKALGPLAQLTTVGRSYRVDLPSGRFDVPRAEALAHEAEAAAGDHDAVVTLADQALALWRGDAWLDLRDVPVLATNATALDDLRVDLLARRAEARLALGEHRGQVPALEELVATYPLREDLCGHLMLALHRSGRQPEAVAAYAAARAHKVEETGLEPGVALREMHARILDDDPALGVEDAVLRARRHLPAQATPLLGRAEEVDELVGLFGEGDRLVSLCGPGGIGKTRVAIQVAHELAARFDAGVWFVPLAALTEPTQLVQAVAEALGAEDAGDPEGRVREHLAGRRLLLVLDNFEQLLDGAPVVSRLLESGPGVAVLVTTRIPLRVYGEQVRTLDPLAEDDAVPLFRDRARRVDHRFDASDEALLRRVCVGLDRLPLAIELVAARADQLTLEQMWERLTARLDLAVEGPRDRPARQQTLRGAVRWSVDLLPGDQAQAFRCLGTFVGGCDEQAAASLGVSTAQLAALTRASLLTRRNGRFEMLETVRDLAVEFLDESEDADRARDDHAGHFAVLAEAAAAGMRGPEVTDWVRRLRAEQANLRAALARLHATAGAEHPTGTRVLQMAADLAMFWYRASPGSADVDWLERALDAGSDASALLRGRAWHGLAVCRGEQGRPDGALPASRNSIELFREAGDEGWLARSLNTLGGLTRDLGRAREARPLIEESVALRRRLADPALPVAVSMANLVMVTLDLGEVATARDQLTELHDQAVVEGQPEIAMVEALGADVELAAGDAAAAEALLDSAVPVLREHELGSRLLECLDTFAALAAHRGRLADAATLVAAADRVMDEEAMTMVPADAAMRERRTGRALATLDPVVRGRAQREGAALDLESAVTWAMDRLLCG